MSGDPTRKQSLYFPEATLKEIMAEATRQDRSISWIVQKAWKGARKTILASPAGAPRSDGNDREELPQGE
jgi:uncharacterized small protein (TIGR04563 family)